MKLMRGVRKETKHAIKLYNRKLGIYPNELKTCVYTKACTKIFITALFINCQTASFYF